MGGELISRAGTAASFVAVWSVAVYQLKVSATVLSILMLCNSLPRVASGWAAGRLIDRTDPKRILIAANVIGCCGSLLQWASHGTTELAVTTLVTVSLMTWVVMPRMTRLLRRWLYPARTGDPTSY